MNSVTFLYTIIFLSDYTLTKDVHEKARHRQSPVCVISLHAHLSLMCNMLLTRLTHQEIFLSCTSFSVSIAKTFYSGSLWQGNLNINSRIYVHTTNSPQ